MIKLEDITFQYGNTEIIRDLSVEFPENKICCILGNSGCGKTTLLNIICGLLPLTHGRISPVEARYSYVFQEDCLIPWLTVYENMVFALKKVVPQVSLKKIVSEYLKAVELEDSAHLFPRELSGGMRQRVSLARAFAYPSDYLLMDEPFTGLNPTLKASLYQLFKTLWKQNKKTVIIVTHDINEATTLSHRIYVSSNIPLNDFHVYDLHEKMDENEFKKICSEISAKI